MFKIKILFDSPFRDPSSICTAHQAYLLVLNVQMLIHCLRLLYCHHGNKFLYIFHKITKVIFFKSPFKGPQ